VYPVTPETFLQGPARSGNPSLISESTSQFQTGTEQRVRASIGEPQNLLEGERRAAWEWLPGCRGAGKPWPLDI
jgi:hypothetical protein